METVNCPICKQLHKVLSRYKLSICDDCINNFKCYDQNGNIVNFCNESMSGGFVSLHRENGIDVKKQDHICYINNIKCIANESRFGGIIIQISE